MTGHTQRSLLCVRFFTMGCIVLTQDRAVIRAVRLFYVGSSHAMRPRINPLRRDRLAHEQSPKAITPDNDYDLVTNSDHKLAQSIDSCEPQSH